MAKREWIWYPKDIEVVTEYGSIFLNITDAKHIYVDASGNGKHLVFRGRRYAMSWHLGLYSDSPSFQVGRDEKGQESRTAIYGDVPPSFKAKITKDILVAVNAYVREHSHLLTEAAIADANNELQGAERKLEEAEAAYNEAIAKKIIAEGRLNTALALKAAKARK